MNLPDIGIVGFATYFPNTIENAAEFAVRSGIPRRKKIKQEYFNLTSDTVGEPLKFCVSRRAHLRQEINARAFQTCYHFAE